MCAVSRLIKNSEDRKITSFPLKKIIVFNFEEQVLSDCYYESMFDMFLKINNYQCVNDEKNVDDIDNESISQYNVLKKQSISSKILYNDIPIIKDLDDEYELIKKQTHKKATRLEKLLQIHYENISNKEELSTKL